MGKRHEKRAENSRSILNAVFWGFLNEKEKILRVIVLE